MRRGVSYLIGFSPKLNVLRGDVKFLCEILMFLCAWEGSMLIYHDEDRKLVCDIYASPGACCK